MILVCSFLLEYLQLMQAVNKDDTFQVFHRHRRRHRHHNSIVFPPPPPPFPLPPPPPSSVLPPPLPSPICFIALNMNCYTRKGF